MQISQNNRVIEHLRKGKWLTHVEAYNKYGVARIVARIDDLKHIGYNIHAETVKADKTRYARYCLIGGNND